MDHKFVVVSGNGNISWSDAQDAPESFVSVGDAEARAKEVAASEPGAIIWIAQVIAEVTAPIGEVKVTRVSL